MGRKPEIPCEVCGDDHAATYSCERVIDETLRRRARARRQGKGVDPRPSKHARHQLCLGCRTWVMRNPERGRPSPRRCPNELPKADRAMLALRGLR